MKSEAVGEAKMIWWVVMAAGAAALVAYANRGQNAVWGTAMLGAPVGLGLAIYEPGFDWWIIARSIAAAALIGLVFELLPLFAGRLRR